LSSLSVVIVVISHEFVLSGTVSSSLFVSMCLVNCPLVACVCEGLRFQHVAAVQGLSIEEQVLSYLVVMVTGWPPYAA